MVAQPVQIVQVVPAQPATFPTSANVTNLMCFASIKPQHARVWGPTIMWCAVPSFSCRVKSSAKRRYSIPKPKKLAMKKFAVLRKLSNLINIILNFGFTLRGIFTMKMKNMNGKSIRNIVEVFPQRISLFGGINHLLIHQNSYDFHVDCQFN